MRLPKGYSVIVVRAYLLKRPPDSIVEMGPGQQKAVSGQIAFGSKVPIRPFVCHPFQESFGRPMRSTPYGLSWPSWASGSTSSLRELVCPIKTKKEFCLWQNSQDQRACGPEGFYGVLPLAKLPRRMGQRPIRQTTPCAIMALATFSKPAILAPATRLPESP